MINFEFDISLATDSDNDHCLFQMKDSDDSSWTIIDYFGADTDGWEHRTYDFVSGGLGVWSGCDSVYFGFRWVSDGSGTDAGVRINDLFLEYGDLGFVKENVFLWDYDMIQTHEVWDLSPWLTIGESFYLEWFYTGDSITDKGFWGIDDVQVYDANGDLLRPEPFDDWLPDRWREDHSTDGCWEQKSVTGWRDPLGPSGSPVAACDVRDAPSFEASLYSPLIYDITDTGITVDFFSSFKWERLYNHVAFNIWHSDLTINEFADDFEYDLSLWTVVDEGSGNLSVIPSSVGSIKVRYR